MYNANNVYLILFYIKYSKIKNKFRGITWLYKGFRLDIIKIKMGYSFMHTGMDMF